MLFNNINDGNIVATFIEASTFKGYKCTKNEDVPKEFKSIAIKVAETAESVIGRKIGEGVDSIIFGKLSYQIANKIEKIKNEKHPEILIYS